MMAWIDLLFLILSGIGAGVVFIRTLRESFDKEVADPSLRFALPMIIIGMGGTLGIVFVQAVFHGFTLVGISI